MMNSADQGMIKVRGRIKKGELNVTINALNIPWRPKRPALETWCPVAVVQPPVRGATLKLGKRRLKTNKIYYHMIGQIKFIILCSVDIICGSPKQCERMKTP